MNIHDVAAKYLASRSRTCGEMRKHLSVKGYEEMEIQEVVDEFVGRKYLDDALYCSQYFDYGFGKGKGFSRIKQELLAKGVSSETIEIAFEDYEGIDTEEERALRQAEKLVSGKNEIDEKLLAKIGRRLSSLGYSTDIIYKIIDKYRKGRDEDSI